MSKDKTSPSEKKSLKGIIKTKMEQLSAKNPNSVLNVAKDGTILYSNEAGEHLLHEWGLRVGNKLPPTIGKLVQQVIFQNIPEKMEVKVGSRVYLIAFHPSPEEECVNIYGFDISDNKDLEEKIRKSEAREMANVELAEVIDVHSIKPLMDDLFRLVHIPIGINDLKGNVLTGAGWQDICTKFHRIHLEACKHCLESYIKLSSSVHPGEFKLYKCKNNMYDIVTPIMAGSQHVGYVIGGQFFFDDEPLDFELFRSQARKYGFNEEEYIAALEKVPRLSREAVETGMSFFMTFANMLSQLNYSNVKLAKSLSERDTLLEALREGEEKYRHIVETTREGIWLIDRNDRTVFINQKVSKMLGYSIDEILGQLPQKFLASEFRAVADDRLREHRQVVNKTFDYRFIRKDGSDLWCILSPCPLFDDEGKYAGSLGVLTDITERKRTEEALQESEEKYRNIVETANEGVWIFNSVSETTYVNDKMTEMLGYSREEMVSSFIWDYADEADKGFSQVKLANRKQDIDEVYELKLMRKEGSYVWLLVSAKSIFDKNGKFAGSLGMFTDITERKKMEEALKKANETLEEQVKERTAELERAYNSLKESEEKYRNIVETANEGIGIIDDKAIITYANRKLADLLGYTVEEGIGLPIWGFIGEECKDIVKLNMEKRLQGFNESYEYKLMHKGGSHIWVFMSAKPLFDDTGKFIGIMSMFTDVTKRKEAEESLANIEIARKKEIHHRIKNNLQVISSLLDLQAEKFKHKQDIKDSDVLEALKESQDRVVSMALIHEELHKGDELDTLDFSSYIKKLANNLFLTYRLGEIDISLNMDLEERIFFDMDTAVPLGMIINELVSNSFKHAFSGRSEGEIRIKLHREEKGEYKKSIKEVCSTIFTLSISDNGVGIPENLNIEDLDSLGMQLVTSLIDQLDGELEVKRDNGAAFIIRFTVAEKNN